MLRHLLQRRHQQRLQRCHRVGLFDEGVGVFLVAVSHDAAVPVSQGIVVVGAEGQDDAEVGVGEQAACRCCALHRAEERLFARRSREERGEEPRMPHPIAPAEQARLDVLLHFSLRHHEQAQCLADGARIVEHAKGVRCTAKGSRRLGIQSCGQPFADVCGKAGA